MPWRWPSVRMSKWLQPEAAQQGRFPARSGIPLPADCATSGGIAGPQHWRNLMLLERKPGTQDEVSVNLGRLVFEEGSAVAYVLIQ